MEVAASRQAKTARWSLASITNAHNAWQGSFSLPVNCVAKGKTAAAAKLYSGKMCSVARYLQRLMCTELFCITPSISASSVYIGPTSQVKKAGVIRAFSSAPHLEYGKTFLNQPGTLGNPLITASLCSAAVLPCMTLACCANAYAFRSMHCELLPCTPGTTNLVMSYSMVCGLCLPNFVVKHYMMRQGCSKYATLTHKYAPSCTGTSGYVFTPLPSSEPGTPRACLRKFRCRLSSCEDFASLPNLRKLAGTC